MGSPPAAVTAAELRALGGPRAVHAVVVGLPALAADLPLRVLVHDLEEAVGARHREDRRAVAGEVLDDALPKLQQNPGVDVEEAEVDLGVLQVRVVGELRHHAVAVAEREADVVRGAFDVLRDQDVGAGLADSDQARQVKLPAHRDAPVGEIDVRHRGFAHADVEQRDDLLDFGKQRRGKRGRGEPQRRWN